MIMSKFMFFKLAKANSWSCEIFNSKEMLNIEKTVGFDFNSNYNTFFKVGLSHC